MIRAISELEHPLLKQLPAEIEQRGVEQLDVLVISHQDPALSDALEAFFAAETMAVLALPQCHWNFEVPSAETATATAIEHWQVGRLMLVGHSQGGRPGEETRVYPAGPSAGRPSLVDRVCSARQRVVASEQHFRQQLQVVRQHPAIAARIEAGTLQLQALFYRAESGLFCEYDQQTDQFRALCSVR